MTPRSISLESWLDVSSEAAFWDSVARAVRVVLPRDLCNAWLPLARSLASSADFLALFDGKLIHDVFGAKVLLIIDEFDEVFIKCSQSMKNSLLGALRNIRDNRKNFGVKVSLPCYASNASNKRRSCDR